MPDPNSSLMPTIQKRIADDHAAKAGRTKDMLTVWTNSDFLDLSTRWAVDKAMQKLVNNGFLERPRRGYYHLALPANSLTGAKRFPSQRAYLDAIVRRDKINVIEAPALAANQLGIEDMVPKEYVVYSDGTPRRVPIPNPVNPEEDIHLEFKRLAPRHSFWAGHPAMRFVQTFEWYKVQFTETANREAAGKVLDKIAAKLAGGGRDGANAVLNDLRDNITAVKPWMQPVVLKLIQEVEHRFAAEHALGEAVEPSDEPESEGMRP